jgi:hypothetical protein
LQGKRFSNAKVQIFATVATFSYPTPSGSVTWQGNQQIDIQEFASNTCKRIAVNEGNQFFVGVFLPPLGEFNCERLIVNGVNSGAGMMRCVIQQCDVTEPINGRPVLMSTQIISHAELLAFFAVGLQESGQYVYQDPNQAVDTLAIARARTILPNEQAGRVTNAAFYTEGNGPLAILGVSLFAATLGQWTFNETTGTRQGETASSQHFLGTAVFNSAQTQQLLAGQTVEATDWLQGNDSDHFPLFFPQTYIWSGATMVNPPGFGYRARFTLNVESTT